MLQQTDNQAQESQHRDDLAPQSVAETLVRQTLLARGHVRFDLKQRQAGMTLIEIMIVVVIMALVATGVGIAVIPQLQKAKIKQAESGVETVRSAVQLYMATNNAPCATMPQLIEDKAIDKSKATTDPWDRDYKIECEGTEITVVSAGPDGQFDTEDDIK